MGAKEKATALHEQGFNCAQSVLGALGSYTGLDEKSALAVSAGFGGGVRCGEICGAVSGAVMALGLCNPHSEGDDAAARAKMAKLTMAMTRDFAEHFGCVRCFDLKRAGKSCPVLIEYAAEKAEELIQNNR